ncbi:uncharacterized protein [Blastocystis hominis]|uniref:Signal recognition particle receptor subunit beta n=1 Tax=Blastocystis hominis TaxID=12968 RepID=D8LXP7_BLAHO|nr:uncharacterized protein [Blastocystis hominis]XP_012897839.1 uncharacterized protein [Blastocystis hominis]CBK20352.2 unnamed protein product [Blastocystis hominis]CBK23791.2 unnamed protein product [Blastocystis hominis]|eukprot:XP_012894400.1 uncharacterized protein [Blastocystis hominis]
MSSLYLQYDNLPTSILTYFYYFQFKIASFFHVTDQQAFGIALMIVLTAGYLLLVALIAARVFWKTRGRRAQTIHGDTILLLGPCDSGKTSFFYLTTQEQVPQTVTSMKENVASFSCAESNEKESQKVLGKIVDFPGHPSVRNQLEKYFSHTSGIVFMLDGSHYSEKEVAEFLYDIFVNPSFVSHPCPLLLAVNKSDLSGCEDNQSVFDRIENELYRY